MFPREKDLWSEWEPEKVESQDQFIITVRKSTNEGGRVKSNGERGTELAGRVWEIDEREWETNSHFTLGWKIKED